MQETRQEEKREERAFSRSRQILFIVFNIQFIADIVIFVEVIIIDIHDAKASICFRNFQQIEQVPAWPSEIIRCSIKNEAVACPIELVVSTAYALVISNQQVFMLVDHAKTEISVHCNNELWLIHNEIRFSFRASSTACLSESSSTDAGVNGGNESASPFMNIHESPME